MSSHRVIPCVALAVTGLAIACSPAGDNQGGLSGSIQIDGSSTVFPVSEAAAEDFMLTNPGVRITVAFSGTGGGFKRFCAGETAISDASRPITQGEMDACAAAGVEYLELPVAYDGLSVVANPAADFVECLSIDELRRIWQPDSDVSSWSDVRAGFPDRELHLFGPGTDSGTFDYFTEEVVGTAKASRTDFQASEDDNVLVLGVAGDEGSLGYFGYAYYAENQGRLKLLGVDGGGGCVLPSDATIEDGTYPLARPLLIYVRTDALARPEVQAFVEFYLTQAPELVPSTGYHSLPAERYQESLSEVSALVGM
jgi:phosphate transport system substrate-binding protein